MNNEIEIDISDQGKLCERCKLRRVNQCSTLMLSYKDESKYICDECLDEIKEKEKFWFKEYVPTFCLPADIRIFVFDTKKELINFIHSKIDSGKIYLSKEKDSVFGNKNCLMWVSDDNEYYVMGFVSNAVNFINFRSYNRWYKKYKKKKKHSID